MVNKFSPSQGTVTMKLVYSLFVSFIFVKSSRKRRQVETIFLSCGITKFMRRIGKVGEPNQPFASIRQSGAILNSQGFGQTATCLSWRGDRELLWKELIIHKAKNGAIARMEMSGFRVQLSFFRSKAICRGDYLFETFAQLNHVESRGTVIRH